MAIGPSVSFFAPNWEPDVTRSVAPRGNPVPVGPFHAWLRELGFLQHPGPGNFFTRKPVDIYVHRIDEEVAFATIDFGVVNDAPDRVSAWQTFVEELCGTWGFSLTDSQTQKKVSVSQFRRILAQDRIWRIVSDVNGWPPIWPTQPNANDGQSAEPISHESVR
jgi:hypothetical protein